jgi:hypothetical protein
MITLQELDNKSILKLSLDIVNNVIPQYNFTLKILNLLKIGYNLLYYHNQTFSIKVNSSINFHNEKEINDGCNLLYQAIYCYLYVPDDFYISIYNTINYFRNFVDSSFTDEELINAYLMFINTRKCIIGNQSGYIIESITGAVKTKYYWPNEFIKNDKYYRFYISQNSINMIYKNSRSEVITFGESILKSDFNLLLLNINKSIRDYQNYLYNQRKRKVIRDNQQETFII